MDAHEGKVIRSTAIFAVGDVVATANFYRDVLAFEIAWTWGEPPNFGCVRRGEFEIYLCQQPEVAAKVEGHQHWFGVDDADATHALHRSRGAQIVQEISDRPWGAREYVVRDPNGYHVRFGGPIKYVRPTNALDKIPTHIRIEPRLPTVDEYVRINKTLGWQKDVATVAPALAGSLCGVVAIDTRDTSAVGMARAVGDGVHFIYVQDVNVIPEYQHQKIGSAIMESLMTELRRRFTKGASVYLFTGKPAFYEPFGFHADPCGMRASL
jgi:catechol 2,3-dioxygenase-like lactoylglutathione lyase family enzyme